MVVLSSDKIDELGERKERRGESGEGVIIYSDKCCLLGFKIMKFNLWKNNS